MVGVSMEVMAVVMMKASRVGFCSVGRSCLINCRIVARTVVEINECLKMALMVLFWEGREKSFEDFWSGWFCERV